MKLKRGVFHFKKPIFVSGFSAVVGEMEGQGPLKDKFDRILMGDMFGEKSFEKAESKMQQISVIKAMQKAGLTADEIDVIFAGDLLNQCIGTSYGLRELFIPFIGLYGACSTMAEAILVACVFLDSGHVKKAVCVTSSHFCAAERQFRFPLEYGGQRPMTAQWTATAAGSIILEDLEKGKIIVKSGCVGEIIDFGVKDINNMGAAMAPAAASTIIRFFQETKTSPLDYDLILTGDLGSFGSKALYRLTKEKGYDLEDKHNDCGLMLYDLKKQDVHSGGSGAGCSACVLASDVLDRLKNQKLKNVLFIATGALMSTTTNQQGETIPAVAHLVHLQRSD